MYQLKDEQYDLIRREVEKQGIQYRHLATELTDHLCCEVEELVWQGLSFEDSFNRIKKVIGTDTLQQIQKDTLYLTDKTYRIMKNIIKVTGVAGMAIISFGVLFRIQHWEGGSLLLTAGFGLLGLVYFPFSLFSMRKESRQFDQPVIFSSALIGGLMLIFAPLLKVMHWPGAAILFILAYGILGLVLVPAILKKLWSEPGKKELRNIFIVAAFALIVCLAGSLAKILHAPGALALLVLGSIGVSTVFLPLYTMQEFKDTKGISTSYILLTISILYFNIFNLLVAMH